MASAMMDRGVLIRQVGILALVMLSACSREPADRPASAEIEFNTSEPAQEQRADARADCRDEVAAAFERLKTSGRPYRKEIIFVASDGLTFHGTAEFLPPDRMREITNNGVAGYGTNETIRVGQRAWSNTGGWPWDSRWPWGWREWDAWMMQAIRERGRPPALADSPIPANVEFECLGRVEFEGSAYIGYRDRARWPSAVVSEGSPSQEPLRKLQKMARWRTVFVDPHSRLPAHDLVAQKDQLDSPSYKVRYTYPNDIEIEPPLWCRVGLCPVSR
jgi:hypothetical protein